MAAHQAPPSLGFSKQEHWSGLPSLSPVHESEKWKWGRSVVSDSLWPHELQPTRLLHPWDFSGQEYWSGVPLPSLDPTCLGANKAMRHNYWACALEPGSHDSWAHVSQLLKPTCLGLVLSNKKSPQWEACTLRIESGPHFTTTRENPHAAMKTQHCQK